MSEAIDRAVDGFLARPLWRAWTFVLLIVLAASTFSERGPAVGAIAVAVYVVVGGAFVLWPTVVSAWTERHPMVDGLFVIPITFLALATLTEWPLGLCAACGAGVWSVLAIVRPG